MLSVRLDSNLQNELNSLSKQQNISKSKIIKDSLIYYFDMLKQTNQQKSSYEIGQEFFGKYSSKQGDLSTTYKQKLKDKINAKNNNR